MKEYQRQINSYWEALQKHGSTLGVSHTDPFVSSLIADRDQLRDQLREVRADRDEVRDRAIKSERVALTLAADLSAMRAERDEARRSYEVADRFPIEIANELAEILGARPEEILTKAARRVVAERGIARNQLRASEHANKIQCAKIAELSAAPSVVEIRELRDRVAYWERHRKHAASSIAEAIESAKTAAEELKE